LPASPRQSLRPSRPPSINLTRLTRTTAAGLVMPYCDSQAMNEHLKEISAQVEPGHHAVVLLDQEGWHISEALRTPANVTLLALPAKAPELNPVENLWQF